MEPLTALGVVANVLQLIDFSASVVSKSSELSRSVDGRLVKHTEISVMNNDLAKLSATLSQSLAQPLNPTVLSEDEQTLLTLCQGCLDVSEELQGGLDKLQVKGPLSKWKSVRKALKTVWTKEKIAEL